MEVVNIKFKSGLLVKDKVTGITGIINAQAKWINGCIRYSVQPKAKKGNNEIPESYWIDEAQIKKVGKGFSIEQTPNGGPSKRSKFKI